jgi:hypothetical protein
MTADAAPLGAPSLTASRRSLSVEALCGLYNIQ